MRLQTFRVLLSGTAMLIGCMALLRGEWLVGVYWCAIELYWVACALEELNTEEGIL